MKCFVRAGGCVRLPLAVLALLAAGLCAAGGQSYVGRQYEWNGCFLPGPELRVRRQTDRTDPVVLRIAATYPHGTAGFRYDFVWAAMEPGRHDLTRYLERVDGSDAGELPELVVEAVAELPAGPPGMLENTPQQMLPTVGGYRYVLTAGVIVWSLAGVLLFRWLLRRRLEAAAGVPESGQSLADRLRPLLKQAMQRPLTTAEKARMERLILGFGRERLGLRSASDPVVWNSLRSDAATASWLRILEDWLHRPAGNEPSEADFRSLLAAISASTEAGESIASSGTAAGTPGAPATPAGPAPSAAPN